MNGEIWFMEIGASLIDWADVIFVMEQKHQKTNN